MFRWPLDLLIVKHGLCFVIGLLWSSLRDCKFYSLLEIVKWIKLLLMRDVRGTHLSRQISMEVTFLAKVNTLSCNWTTAVWTSSLHLLILIIMCCFFSTTRCLVVFRSSFLPRLSECWQIRIEIQILPFLPSPPSSSPSPSATSSSCSSPPSLPFRQPYDINISTDSISVTDMGIIWLQLRHINHLEYYIHRVQVILLGLCSLQRTQHCSSPSHLCAVEQHFKSTNDGKNKKRMKRWFLTINCQAYDFGGTSAAESCSSHFRQYSLDNTRFLRNWLKQR